MKNYFWNINSLLFIIYFVLICGINAQPRSGDWTIETDFGEFVIEVNTEGTHIVKIKTTFSNFSCGGITQNGSITSQTSPGWSITNSQFSFTQTIDPFGNIKMNYSGTFTASGTEASGEWGCNVSGTICSGSWGPVVSNVDISSNLSEHYYLDQNYPNPFNSVTTINYSIPEQSIVRLKVFDVLGNDVATLFNKEQLKGNFTIKFDANDLTSGIYFYKLNAGDYTETRKMILMK